MSYLTRGLFGAIVLLLTLSICRAEPKCGDLAVLEAYAEIIKCREILSCADRPIKGGSRDLAKMSDAELRRGTLAIAFNNSPPNPKIPPDIVKMINFTAGLDASMLIGWRDAFRTMKVSATLVNYDPKLKRYTCQGRSSFDPPLLSEAIRRYMSALALHEPRTRGTVLAILAANRDPAVLLAEAVKDIKGLERCFNTSRIFHLQPTSESNFTVKLDQNAIAPGCRKPPHL